MMFFILILVVITAQGLKSTASIQSQLAASTRQGSQIQLRCATTMTSSLSGKTQRGRSLTTDLAYPVVSLPSMACDPRSLNRKIMSLFSPASGKIDVTSIHEFVATHESRFDHIHILTLLHRCAKYGISVPEVMSWAKIAAIIARPHCKFDEQSIGSSLYAMQHYDCSDESLRPYLDVIGVKLDKLISSSSHVLHLNGQALGNAIYGMNKWTGNNPESQRILSALSMLIEKSIEARKLEGLPPISMNAQEMGTALWGLQSMSSSSPLVKRLVSALADCVHFVPPLECGGRNQLRSQNIGMALYGLQGLSSDEEEVQKLLKALVPRIALSLEHGESALDPQAIGNSLLGLRSMSSNNPQIQDLLVLLALGIDASSRQEPFKGLSEQELSCAFSGLQNMRATVPAVERVLQSIVRKVRATTSGLRDKGPQGMNPKGLAIAVHGLKSMTTDDSQAVSAVLSLLSGMVFPSRNPETAEWFNSQSLAMFMTGLRGASIIDEGTKAMIVASLAWVYREEMEGAEGVALSGAEVGMVLAGLRRIDSKSDASRQFIDAIAKRIALLDNRLTHARSQPPRSTMPLKGSDFSAALGGLGGIGGDSIEGCNLLAALYNRIALNQGGMTSMSMTRGEACVALFGLRGFLGSEGALSPVSHRIIVEKLLKFLMEQISTKPFVLSTDFSGRSFGMAVYALATALNKNDAGAVSAAAVIAALEGLIVRLREEELTSALDPAAIGMSLYALRCLKEAAESEDAYALQPLLDALGSTIHDSLDNHTAALSGHELAVCITNVRKISSTSSQTDDGVRSVLGALARNLDRTSGNTLGESSHISEGEAVLIMHSIQSMDLSLKEARLFMTSFAKRLREQTQLEISGAKACFIPMAPLLLGFFMMQTQLSEYWKVLESAV